MSTDAMRAALAEMEDAINCEGFGCACYVGYQCHTCRARDVLEKTVRKPFDKLRAALAQPSVSRDAFCWLVELFEGDGSGNSAGWYHTGFTDIGGHARTTKNLHDARRYRTREQAEQVAAKLGHTLTGTWRAVEHGFQVRVQPSVPDKRDALLLAANCCESIYAPGTWDEDDDRWMIETHCGKFYGQLLTDALADFWRSALRACDAEGRPTEPDPFASCRASLSDTGHPKEGDAMTMMPFKGRCHTCGHDHDSDEEMFAGLRELMKPERDATIESQAAQIAALTAERDALRADAERLRIRGAAYEAAYGIAYQATYQSHNGHWDRTMQGGIGCRECIRAREARENCDKALREGLEALAARASLNTTTTRSEP